MKTKSSATTVSAKQKLLTSMAAAQRQADTAKRQAKLAKLGLRQAKQKFKDAKRAAKKLRKAVKSLKAELAALNLEKTSHKPAPKKSAVKRALPVAPQTPVIAAEVAPLPAEIVPPIITGQ